MSVRLSRVKQTQARKRERVDAQKPETRSELVSESLLVKEWPQDMSPRESSWEGDQQVIYLKLATAACAAHFPFA